LPVEFGNYKPPLHRDLPKTGADNTEVLKELGLDDEAIAALASEGVLGG
jgi:crotonobetainyl-CoA:carnitine CoA-transferase CaiB-like acyl-CoA transferase